MGRFQNNLSIGWVHPKSSIHARPLAWGNNKFKFRNLQIFFQNFIIQKQINEVHYKALISRQ
jgi:hypothetical protein